MAFSPGVDVCSLPDAQVCLWEQNTLSVLYIPLILMETPYEQHGERNH